MELELSHYVIAIVGGIVAGSMNALAGYGSIITLTILMDVIGLPPVVANATNRISVGANALSSYLGFRSGGKFDIKKGKWIILATLVGALAGIILAIYVSNEQFRAVFKYLIIVLFLTILVNPKRWLKSETEDHEISLWLMVPIFLVIGFYGGFIQMGMGIAFLAGIVLVAKFNIIEANMIKVFAVGIYTFLAIAIFQYKGLLDWKAGLLLAIGQAIGGYTTAAYAARSENATKWAYWFLVVIVLGVIIYQFVYPYL